MNKAARDLAIFLQRERGIRYGRIARLHGITPAYWQTLLEKHAACRNAAGAASNI